MYTSTRWCVAPELSGSAMSIFDARRFSLVLPAFVCVSVYSTPAAKLVVRAFTHRRNVNPPFMAKGCRRPVPYSVCSRMPLLVSQSVRLVSRLVINLSFRQRNRRPVILLSCVERILHLILRRRRRYGVEPAILPSTSLFPAPVARYWVHPYGTYIQTGHGMHGLGSALITSRLITPHARKEPLKLVPTKNSQMRQK